MSRLHNAETGAAIGLVAGAVAVAVGDFVAAFTGLESAPVIAVGSAAIELTPTPLKDWTVQRFGTHDKTVLLSGIYATMAVLAVLAGLLALRRLWAGVAVFPLFAGLGLWAPSSRDAALPPSAVAGLAGGTALVLLVRLARPQPQPREAGETPAGRGVMGRRGFLLALGATAVGVALTESAARALTTARYNVAKARAALRLPAPVKALPPVPAAVHPAVAGPSPFTTPSPGFYRVDTALTLPQVAPSSSTLRVHGMVDRPIELSFDQLLRRPLRELDYTLSCVSNEVGGPYAGTARWLGASLPDLLREAGVRRGAEQLVGRSATGMTIGTPVELVLYGREALLAVGMNGEPLPIAHGFPCRSLVPGLFGYTSATKWLVDLELTTLAALGPYWVHRGWDRTGLVRTASRIEVPGPFARVPAGQVTVAGTAWATHRGVAAVEVRVDGGRGSRRGSPPPSAPTSGVRTGPGPGTPTRPARTRSRSGPPTAPARCSPGSATRPSPPGRPAGTARSSP